MVLTSLATPLCQHQRVFLFWTVFCSASVGVLNSEIPGCHLKGKVSRNNDYWHVKRPYLDSRPKRLGWEISSVMSGSIAKNTFCELQYNRDQALILGGHYPHLFIAFRNWQFHTLPWKHYNFLPLFVFPRNGEQLRILCEDNHYDFRLQEIRDMKEILIIKPVRSSAVQCSCGQPGWRGGSWRAPEVSEHVNTLCPSSRLRLWPAVLTGPPRSQAVVLRALSVALWWYHLLCSLGGWDPGGMQLSDTGSFRDYFCKLVFLPIRLPLVLKSVYHH